MKTSALLMALLIGLSQSAFAAGKELNCKNFDPGTELKIHYYNNGTRLAGHIQVSKIGFEDQNDHGPRVLVSYLGKPQTQSDDQEIFQQESYVLQSYDQVNVGTLTISKSVMYDRAGNIRTQIHAALEEDNSKALFYYCHETNL